jgi:hypothetical protein
MDACHEYRCDKGAEDSVYDGRREYRVCAVHRDAVAADEAVTLRSDTPGFITGFGRNILSLTPPRRLAAKEGAAVVPRGAKRNASRPVAGTIAAAARGQHSQMAFAL